MSKFIFTALILFAASIALAGDKVYTEEDLEKYKKSTVTQPTDRDEERDTKSLSERISWFDLRDIKLEIEKTNDEIWKLTEEKLLELIECKILSSTSTGSIVAQSSPLQEETSRKVCEQAVVNKYDRLIDPLISYKGFLNIELKELSQKYEEQESKGKK